MNLKMNRSILLDEIVKANKIIDPKNINPEMLGVLVIVEPERVIFTSTNGSLNWKSFVNKNIDPHLETKQVGKFLVKGKYFIDILRKMEDEVVELVVVEDSELIINGKNLKFKLQILDANQFPLIGFREHGNEIDLDPKEFKKAISQVIVSIDEFNKKIILTGMNLKGSQGASSLEIYTTDSFRISRRVLKLNKKLEFDIDINIPLKTLSELIRLADTYSEMRVIIIEGYLTVNFDNHSLFQSTLIEGKFPNVERAFPDEYATKVILNKSKIIKSINRANIGNEDNIAQTVTLDINSNVINLTSQSADIGNYDEKFTDFNFDGESQLISFNIKFLLEALRTFDNDQLEFDFINASRPLEIKEFNNDSLKQLILPLALN